MIVLSDRARSTLRGLTDSLGLSSAETGRQTTLALPWCSLT